MHYELPCIGKVEKESDVARHAWDDDWANFGGSIASKDSSDGLKPPDLSVDEFGTFHKTVTPSPTVITLCGNITLRKPQKIDCHPLPDAFNPCEDIMGSIWLRGAVW